MDVSTGVTYPVQLYTRSIDLILAPIASRVSYKSIFITVHSLSLAGVALVER